MSQTPATTAPVRNAARVSEEHPLADVQGFAGSALMRGVAFSIGVAFFVTAVGIWAFSATDASVMLIKLGASIFFLGGAAVFMMLAIAPHDFYRLEFDRKAGTFRVLERDVSGRFVVQSTRQLSEFDKIRFQAGALRAWNAKGELVMSVPMRARYARRVLRSVLAA